MATVRIIQRSKKALTLVIDHGIDPITKKRKKENRTLDTVDMEVAEAERLKVLADLAEGAYKPTSKTTLKEYCEYWLTTPAAKKLEPKTIERYKECLNGRIIPWIGHLKLATLKRSDLLNFYEKIIEVGHLSNLRKENSDKPKRPIGKTTLEHHQKLIHRILNYALYEDEIIKKNVADRIVLPEPERPEDYDPDEELVKVFTANEINKLEEAAVATPYGNMIAVALRTGMRREELLALTWDCIDKNDGTIFIKKALSCTREAGYKVKSTKNKKKRKIEATTEVLAAFERESKKQAAHKLRLGENYNKKLNLVFCREDGYFLHPNTPTSWFPDFCTEIGITKLNFHCLRHTHASHLLAAGEDISYVSRRLGHSDIFITYSTYFHFIPLEKREALKEMEKRFKK